MPPAWPISGELLTHGVAFASAAMGALLGSLSAYLLGRRQQRADKRDEQYGATLMAQYSLMSQWNILEGIRRQHLEPLREDPNRAMKLAIYYAPSLHHRVPFEGIAFITRTKEPNLLQVVHIAEQSFHTATEALSIRNGLLQDFYKNPAVERERFDPDTGRALIRADPKDVFFIRQATDVLYRHVDSALPKLKAAAESLEKFIKSEFKGARALRMEEIVDAPKA